MATALAERTTGAELLALADYVRAIAGHPQIDARPGGELADERDGHPSGTPYVTIVVPTVAAAELAEERLGEVGRVDATAWVSGWRLVDGPALELDIYPDGEASEARAFVDNQLSAQARRCPHLEALVRDKLAAAAPDVVIVDSGIDAGRAFVVIRAASVDGADRAEGALAAFALSRPWRLEGRALVTRVYI